MARYSKAHLHPKTPRRLIAFAEQVIEMPAARTKEVR
jgi:hypothetical protein